MPESDQGVGYGEGLEWRWGIVTAENPVQFHEHKKAHVLVACGPGVLDVYREDGSMRRMVPGDLEKVSAKQRHRLTVPSHTPCRYVCTGPEGLG